MPYTQTGLTIMFINKHHIFYKKTLEIFINIVYNIDNYWNSIYLHMKFIREGCLS